MSPRLEKCAAKTSPTLICVGRACLGGGDACRTSAQIKAGKHCVRCYGVDYRMPPPYPAALDDRLTAYQLVLERHSPHNVIIGGRNTVVEEAPKAGQPTRQPPCLGETLGSRYAGRMVLGDAE